MRPRWAHVPVLTRKKIFDEGPITTRSLAYALAWQALLCIVAMRSLQRTGRSRTAALEADCRQTLLLSQLKLFTKPDHTARLRRDSARRVADLLQLIQLFSDRARHKPHVACS